MAQDMPTIITPGDVIGKSHTGKGSSTAESIILSEQHKLNSKGTMVRTRKITVRRAARKEESLFRLLCAWIVENQLGLASNLILLLFGTHILFPRLRPHTTKFFRMSHHDEATNTYIPGPDCLYFVFFWLVVITGLRVAIMDYVLKPFARWGGIKSKKGEIRFAEQGWLCFYASASFGLGMYIMFPTPYFGNLRELWTEWPTRSVSPIMNWYYLVQFAFWLQQIFVVHIEERRKDHWQMFSHHIVTCALLVCSYSFYQTKVGHMILCIMDVVDILLAFAKMLNYLNYRTACDISFGVFMVSWFVARHVIYLAICWSLWADAPAIIDGCFNFTSTNPTVPGELIPDWDNGVIWSNIFKSYTENTGEVCFNPKIRLAFLSMLLALQGLTIVWFGMIIRVAYRVLIGKAAEDVRSDDEAEDEIEMVDIEEEAEFVMTNGAATATLPLKQMQYQEEEVGVEGLHHVKRKSTPVTRSRTRKTGGRASGISIPGHGDHKELLGRIGCDKPI